MTRRLKVNRAAGHNHVVVDAGTVHGPYPTIVEAFAQVLALDGRVHLDWDRTVIAGEANAHDFTATFEGESAGRIYFIDNGGSTTAGWKAYPGGHNLATGQVGGGAELADSKDEAVGLIELMFTRLMAGPETSTAA